MLRKDIEIRTLTTYKEMLETERLHRIVWRYPEPYSPKILLTISQTGGQIVGAYFKEKLVGFSFTLLARDKKGLYLRSQLLIVLKEFRGQNIGIFLRMAQGDYAKSGGINRIEWTFEPLQAKLGYFYIRKLGAIVKRYAPNLYNQPKDNSKRRLSKDRFYAEWYIDSKRVLSRINRNFSPERGMGLEIDKKNLVNIVVFSKKGVPEIVDYNLSIKHQKILIEIPERMDDILNTPNILEKWRRDTQEIFDIYINKKKYSIVDFITFLEDKNKRSFYLLNKKPGKEW